MKSSQHRCKIFLLDFHKHSLCTQKSAKLNSTDQKFIVHDCKVSDSTSFFCSHDHHESSRSYLAKHWRSGQNSMISQALHNRNTKMKIHVFLHYKDLHSSILSSPARTLTLFSTGSPLTATKNLSPSLCLASYPPTPLLLSF
jgi:hypothetical protein